ncbi:hypothetical protein ACFL21_00915 [Patescibacteria group bacterium]
MLEAQPQNPVAEALEAFSNALTQIAKDLETAKDPNTTPEERQKLMDLYGEALSSNSITSTVFSSEDYPALPYEGTEIEGLRAQKDQLYADWATFIVEAKHSPSPETLEKCLNVDTVEAYREQVAFYLECVTKYVLDKKEA